MKRHPVGLRVAVLDEEGRELVGLVAVDPVPDAPGVYEVEVRDERHPRAGFSNRIEHDPVTGGPWALLQHAIDYAADMTGRGRPPDDGPPP